MAGRPSIRWHQRLQSFGRAFARLSDAAGLAARRPLSDLEQQGLIQAFEFTHELAWKTLKDFLEDRGVTDLHGSRDVVREAFARGLVEDGEEWMAMIAARSRSSHTYDEAAAHEIASAVLARFVPCFAALLARLRRIAGEDAP